MIICEDDKCTGCGACSVTCPHSAINIVVAPDGFFRPKIDVDKCVECKLCVKTCPVNNKPEPHYPKETYMAWDKNLESRLRSSSGGVFGAVASSILIDYKGAVFGAAYDSSMNLVHIGIESVAELPKLQGSKYVQSNSFHVFSSIRDLLKKGRKVYFVGTPCQVAGLKSYLHKDYPNLITSDLICHGTPSNKLFKSQIDELDSKGSSRITDFIFRSKERFGQGYDVKICKEPGGSNFMNAELVPYFYGFWHNITLRESCYNCPFATVERQGDITLADYWGGKKIHKGLRVANGVSLILCNTDKGKDLLSSVCSLHLVKDSLDNALKVQGHLSHSVKMPKRHRAFREDCIRGLEFRELKQKYLTPDLKYTIKMRLRNMMKIVLMYKLWK